MGIGSDCKWVQGISWGDGNVLKLSCDDDHNCVNLLIAQFVKHPPAVQETPVLFLGQKDPLEKGKATHSSILGLPCVSAGKESTCSATDPSWIPGSERSTGEGIGYPLQYSWAFLVAQLVKKSTCNVGNLASIPVLGRLPGEGKDYPLQDSGLENSMDCMVPEVAKSWT